MARLTRIAPVLGLGRHSGDYDNGLRQRKIVGDGKLDGEIEAGGRDLARTRERAAGERDGGLAAPKIDDAHVAPEDAAPEPRSQRFRASLLGGEALGVTCGAIGAAVGFR